MPTTVANVFILIQKKIERRNKWGRKGLGVQTPRNDQSDLDIFANPMRVLRYNGCCGFVFCSFGGFSTDSFKNCKLLATPLIMRLL